MKTLRPREERGSALLLVVFMALVFTVLGVAIMGATLGGAKRAETRENDVQSLHLAERALNEAAAEIALKFDKQEGAIDLEQLPNDLKEIQAKVNGSDTKSGLQGAKGKILGIELPDAYNTQSIAGAGKPVDKVEVQITIKTEAEVNGVRRILAQDITLDSYPEFLKYAFGSESNVNINGAPYIIGDFYSGLDLRAKNQAEYRYNRAIGEKDQFTPSQFPTLDGDIYVQNEKSILSCTGPDYCDYQTGSNYSPIQLDGTDDSKLQLKTVVNNTIDNIVYRDKSKFVSVNIEESFLDKLAEASGDSKMDRDNPTLYPGIKDINKGSLNNMEAASAYASESAHQRIQSLANRAGIIDLPEKPTYPTSDKEDDIQQYYEDFANYQLLFASGQGLDKTAIYDGSLTINGNELQQMKYDPEVKNKREVNGSYMKSAWLIVNGNLTIDNQSGAPLEILGNILVNGDVKIRGRVSMDATIITLGKATIEDAEIAGLKVNGVEKELLLIAKGKIFINRVDSFNTIASPFMKGASTQGSGNPPLLKAFFYTDSDAELYGVGSAFWIRGGFFAKGELTINAVLGDTPKPSEDATNIIPKRELNEIPVNEQDRLLSRFIIQYDDQIYANQAVGLPRVKTINMRIGKKHFADADK